MRHVHIRQRLSAATASFQEIQPGRVEGRVSALSGLAIDIAGLGAHVSLGDRVLLEPRRGGTVSAEIVGFSGASTRAMAFGAMDGIGPGSAALLTRGRTGAGLPVSNAWLGRVVDPLGRPIDGKGALEPGPHQRNPRANPPEATTRARLGERLETGVRVLDTFTTMRSGQRLGLFAGSGVGKSTLLSMLARQTDCDVAVIALVGERGREVREFLEDDLGPEGLARSVVVIATSDAPPLLRREAAYAAMAIAEHFRDQGKSVLLMMDSVTRFCLALREIGLSAGEPPATRGYPPSVFAELPRLLERAGPGPILPDAQGGQIAGQITGLFTVLVEGDDHNEPVADAVRGILDGHIVLDRKIGEAGRYPAVDVLRSLSRAVPGCHSPDERALTIRARRILATYGDMEDMIRLGAYRAGSDPAVDEAIAVMPALESFLRQAKGERTSLTHSFAALSAALETRHGQ